MSPRTSQIERRILTMGDFSGGEGDFPTTKFPAKFSTRMINFYPTKTGGVAFSPGFQRQNYVQANQIFTSGHVYRKADGTAIVLVAGEGYVYTYASGALTMLIDYWDTAAKVRFITANNTCIMMNGVDQPVEYDGTTVTEIDDIPATAFAGCFHKGRLWVVENNDKLLASYSALYDHTDWITAHNAGYLDFTQILKSGDELTDVQPYMDLLVFYFKNHIAVYSGNTPTDYGDFQIVQMIEGAGAITDTVKGAGTDTFFLSQIGIRSLRQVIQQGPGPEETITRNIADRFQASLAANSAGPFGSAMFQRLGWYMGLVGDTIWCFSLSLGAMFRYKADGINGIFSDSDGSAVYFCGIGFLYKFDDGVTADGTALKREWDPAWIKFFRGGEYGYPKYVEMFSTQAAPVVLSIAARYDQNGAVPDAYQEFTTDYSFTLMDEDFMPDIWDNSFFMDPEEYTPNRIPMFGGGSMMQLSFSAQSTNGPLEINSLNISIVPGGKL